MCKKLVICSFSFSLLFSFFFLSSSVSALSDLVISTGTESYQSICSNSSAGNSLCGYPYVVVDTSNSNPVRAASLQCRGYDSNNNQQSYQWSGTNSDFLIIKFYNIPDLTNVICRISINSSPGSIIKFTESPYPQVSGTISITENGTYDVSEYSYADVNVENEVIYGDYHDDLVAINNSILICAAVCLVIYFFYCIYRMIIRSVK